MTRRISEPWSGTRRGESGACSEDGKVASCPGPGRTQPAGRCQSPPGLKGPLPEDSAFDVSNGGHLSAPG